MVDVPFSWSPGGYPSRRLDPVSLDLPTRSNASPAAVRERVEKWERNHGNPDFQARHLDDMPLPLALESARVWVSLREMFPEVRASHVDFASKKEKDTLGEATSFQEQYPFLRESAKYVDLRQPRDLWTLCDDDELSNDEIRVISQEIGNARAWGDYRSDVTATGTVEISACLGHPRCYKKLLAYWQRRNERAAAAGLPPRVIPLSTSAATYILCHEFGHLVDSELAACGPAATERVYAALSQGVLGIDRPSPRAWRENLWNYPTGYLKENAGAYEGSPERRRETLKVMRMRIGSRLGSYATTNRDELFAESFALSFVARSSSLRADLRLLHTALTSEGLKAERRSSL